MFTKQLFNLIEKDFPKKQSEKWDNTGYQYGCKNQKITNIIIALDLLTDVVEYAIYKNVNLIFIHHPLIFSSFKKEKKYNYKANIFYILKTYNITVYAIHTNYDSHLLYGLNTLILKKLNVKNIINFPKNNMIKKGIFIKSIKIINLINKLKKIFKISIIQHNINNLDKNIKTIAMCAGSGGKLVNQLNNKIDIYITGEIKWNEWIQFYESNISVICLNHYMENYFVQKFMNYLKKHIKKDINIFGYNIKNIIQYK